MRSVSSGRLAAIARIEHMLTAAEAVLEYASRGRAAYDAEPAVRDAILYRLVVLGEAAKAALEADPSIEAELSGVEWSPIARLRDRLAHHYWRTDPDIVWATATTSVPVLKDALVSALGRLR